MDDVNIPSKTIDDSFRKLREILVFQKGRVETKSKDVLLFNAMQSINYLGFEISEAGFKINKARQK